MTTSITVAYGDGIGPEIMSSVLEIISRAGASIQIDVIEIGQRIYEKGWQSGITDSAWETIKKNKVFLKAPITTPQGEGVRSLNVALRKKLGLFANIRPCISYFGNKNIDIVIIRENEEDLYAGIEYRQTQDTYTSIKLITKSESERICRYAFEYAVLNNRKKVTVLVKDNIMKLTDGVFHKAFKEIAKDYPQIKSDSYIVDIGSARIATKPEIFDVVVTSNLYGDIVSDIAAEVTGSVGLCGSVNLGCNYAMFEAVHGSAPDIAGKNIANPSGLLNAAISMLDFIGQHDVATHVYSAWIETIRQGIHTADIYNQDYSLKKVGTKEFTQSVINNLNSNATHNFTAYIPQSITESAHINNVDKKVQKTLIGVDVFIDWPSNSLKKLLDGFKKLELTNDIILGNISVKGMVIWPEAPATPPLVTDCLSCRFIGKENGSITQSGINHLLFELEKNNIEVVKLEKLYVFGDILGFSA